MKRFGVPMVAVALVAIAALLLSAQAPVGAQAMKGKIKIATQGPLSGGQAVLGEGLKNGTQLAVEQLVGPVKRLGFDLEVVPFDDQAKPDVGVANAKNLVTDPDILMVIGHLNSG
ncbi:MAG: ABC transporter substrate-binding protein, partial [bacterium]